MKGIIFAAILAVTIQLAVGTLDFVQDDTYGKEQIPPEESAAMINNPENMNELKKRAKEAAPEFSKEIDETKTLGITGQRRKKVNGVKYCVDRITFDKHTFTAMLSAPEGSTKVTVDKIKHDPTGKAELIPW